MAFGAKKPAKDTHDAAHDHPIPQEQRTAEYYQNPNTQYYPGFEAQRYQRPLPAPSDEGHRTGGVVTNVGYTAEDRIFVDRGDETHGRHPEESHPYVKDQPEAEFHNKSDGIREILPDHEDSLDNEYPVPVRVVRDEPIEDVINMSNSFFVAAGNGLQAIRVLGADRKRTRAFIGTVGIVTGSPVMLSGANGVPAYGFPVPAAATTGAPMVVYTTDELWVSGSAAADTFTVAVYIERTVNADPHHRN